jgi:TonB family protein
VQFVIDKKGNIEKVSIHRGIPDTLDAEAKQVIKKMPNWIPGIKDGKPVSTYFLLPIQFKLG